MTSKQTYYSILNGRRVIPLAILTVLLLSITIITTAFINNGNFALAQSQSQSQSGTSRSANLNDVRNNNTNTKQIPPQQQQLQQQNLSSPPSISQQSQKVHEYTLIAENTTLEIAPGLRVDAWTYNGTIPGPTITATEGDRVIIHFINKTPLPHTIHLHGDHPSQEDGVSEMVPPNGTFTYDVIAQPAGALAYHCHVSPVMAACQNGIVWSIYSISKDSITSCERICFSSR